MIQLALEQLASAVVELAVAWALAMLFDETLNFLKARNYTLFARCATGNLLGFDLNA